jgi:hypothetical protein
MLSEAFFPYFGRFRIIGAIEIMETYEMQCVMNLEHPVFRKFVVYKCSSVFPSR